MPSKKWQDRNDDDEMDEDEFLADRKRGKLLPGFVKGAGGGRRNPCPACGTELQNGWCHRCRRQMSH